MRTVWLPTRPLRAVLLLVAITVGLLALGPIPSAGAHAFLISSNPADGAQLPGAPSQLRLQLSETVVLEQTRIDLVGTGATVQPSHLRLEGASGDPEDPVELVGDLPRLTTGAYRVSWQTLSRDDLHRTAGVFVFGIGQRVAPAGVSEPLPRPEEALLRWLLFAALAACLGGSLAARLFGRAGLPIEARQAESIAADGALSAVLGSWLLLAVQAHSSRLSPPGLLSGSYGGHWLVRELGLVLLVAAAVRARRHPSGRLRALLTLTGAALAGLGAAELGHASSTGLTAVLADTCHLLAAAGWSGAVVLLAVLGYRGLRAGGEHARTVRAALRAFGAPATACIAVIVLSGLYLTSTVVASVDAALLTFYGRVLLAKLALFGAVGVLGWLNHRRVRQAGGPIRRSLLTDAGVALAVLGLAAVLVSSQPAQEPQYLPGAAPVTVPVLDGSVADLQQTLAVRPNLPGHNVVLAEVFDTRRPAPAPITGVSITVREVDGRRIGPLPAQRLPDGRWSTPLDLVSGGRAAVTISVRRAGLTSTDKSFSWVVGGASTASRPATVSNAPIGGLLKWLAALLLLALAGLAGGWLSRHGRPASDPTRPAAAGAELVKTGVG